MAHADIVIGYEDTACMLVTFRSFVFPVMGDQALTAESARQQARALTTFGKRMAPAKIAEVTLIAADAPFPGPEARKIFDAAAPLIAPHYRCVATVFEGTGFRAAMVRGLVTSFQLLTRSSYPQRVFSNVNDAAAWCFTETRQTEPSLATAREVADVLHAVRALAVERGIFDAARAAAAPAAP